MSRAHGIEYHNCFSVGWEEVDDDECPRRTVTARIAGRVGKIKETLQKGRGLSIRVIAHVVNITDLQMVLAVWIAIK